MANPFDQFDEPKSSGNPFDQFDQPKKREATTAGRVKAVAAGANRGFFADLLGLPVDTVANVLDLGRAGIGTVAHAVGRSDLAPNIPDRASIVGSSEWIAKNLSDAGAGKFIDNPNPEDKTSRILYTGGRVAGASITPSGSLTAGQQAANAAKGMVSGLAAGSVGEVAPEWAGVAGMAPMAAGVAVPAAVRGAIRGGESGRQNMVKRMADLKEGGIDNPSVGLATGNSFVNGLENLLSQTPGSIGLFDRARTANVAGMQAKTEGIRDAMSSEYGPVVAGQAIQSDLKTAFPQRTKAIAAKLADKVAELIGPGTVVPVENTLAAAQKLSSTIPGAEATSAEFINPRIARIAQNLHDDVYGALPTAVRSPSGNPTANAALTPEVPQVTVNNSSIWNIPVEPTNPMAQIGGPNPTLNRPAVVMDSITNLPKAQKPLTPLPQRDGPNPTLNLPLSEQIAQQTVSNPDLWNIPTAPRTPLPQRGNVVIQDRRAIPNASLWNAQKTEGIPFDALKRLRTSIGEETQSNAIMGSPEQKQFKTLYAAMSDDMRRAADHSDRTQAWVTEGPLMRSEQPATNALNRANKQFKTAMDRSEELSGLANRDTPEGAYKAVANSLNSGPTIYERLRSAVTPEARQKVAATVVDELGRGTPGTQNAAGDVWSPRTFLTNYNKLYRNDGGQALFTRLPGGETYAKNLAKVAKASEMLGDGAKVWSNPSGTSQALVARGTLGTIGAGAVGGIFYTPLIAPAAVAGGSLALAHQVSQRLLLNPKFVNWLAKAPPVKTPSEAQAYAQRLLVTANMTNDQQFQKDAQDYLNQMSNSGN